MGVFEAIGADTHEEVLFGSDPESGLKTIIAIHSTALGPALGGTRFFPYRDEEEALHDVIRLSKAMTYKAAAAGLDLGGGKAVVIGDPRTTKTEPLLRAYGRTVDSLGGRYITAEDVGTSTDDMAIIAQETSHVAGLPESLGGSGDPSPATARGVVAAMCAVANELWGRDELAGSRVAIQGVGKVGSSLVERLTKAGAETIVTDVSADALERVELEHGSTVVGPDEIYEVDCDIFAPCAMGGSVNPTSIGRLRCAAVVGSANNQLESPGDARRLAERGIVYVPDFLVNAGGIINISEERQGYDWRRAAAAIDRIYDTVRRVLAAASANGVIPVEAAERIAKQRIEANASPHRRHGSRGPGRG